MVALSGNAMAVREALATNTLHEWASRRKGGRALEGRGTAWAIALLDGTEVVVRHSRHGGALAPVLGDVFLAPTRAPRELAIALRLASAGVPTPEVVAYAVYPVVWPFARADVVTRRIAGAVFPDAWRAAAEGPARLEIVRALAQLLRRMRDAGALHPDLNLRNVLVSASSGGLSAYVLDVDRIAFGEPGSNAIGRRNLARVLRSARKWRQKWGVELEDRESLHVLADSLPSAPARPPA